MPLTFGGVTSTRLAIAGSPICSGAVTMCIWHFPTTITAGRRLLSHNDGATFGFDYVWSFGTAGTLNINVTLIGGQVPEANGLKVYTTNKWWFHAFVFSANGLAAPKIYWGDLTTPPVEESYSVALDGAGGGDFLEDAAQEWTIGNSGPSFTVAYQGRLARVMRFDEALTLEQIRSIWNPIIIPPWEVSSKLCFHLPLLDQSANGIKDWGPYNYAVTRSGTLTPADGPGNDPIKYGMSRRGIGGVN